MNGFLLMLLSLSLGGTALALLLVLLRRLLGSRLPSAFYYYAWLVVLLRFVLPLPGLLPLLPDSQAAPVPALPSVVSTTDAAPRPWQGGIPEIGAPAENASSQTAPEAEPTGSASAGSGRYALHPAELLRSAGKLLKEPGFWLRLWGVGVAGSAAYFLLGYLRFRRELKRSLRPPLPSDLEIYARIPEGSRPRLCRSRAVTTPMLVGLFRPILVLPDRTYSPEMLRGILRHELTHYRRGDIAYKWFAVLVTVLHWFNPITRLFRAELDRACELACDEKLLRNMDAAQKQSYGELLISLAAERSLPHSVVATSFAIEKRNLKERLVQIMTYKKRSRASLALVLSVLLLLTGCAGALGPGGSEAASAPAAEDAVSTAAPAVDQTVPPTPEPTARPAAQVDWDQVTAEAQYTNSVTVTTVDEFLAAIAPNTQILLEPGLYDLSTAADYGKPKDSGYYTWEEVYDGYQLVIRDVTDLAILGGGAEDVTIAAVPRYANVLAYRNCVHPLVMMLTAGHTQEPGACSGGVLDFESCQAPYVLGCGLYGCGILGVNAANCKQVTVRDTEIYDCSMGAVWAESCFDVRVENCVVRDCGVKDSDFSYVLFMPQSCTGFAVVNTQVTGNKTMNLLDSRYSQAVALLGCSFANNTVTNYAFSIAGAVPLVEGCAFTGNRMSSYYDPENYTGYAVDREGNDLISFDLDRMQQKDAVYEGPQIKEPTSVSGTPAADGVTTEYHVSTVDEFLAAIGPDATIYIDADYLDLSTASNYGGYGSQYYYWEAQYDGPSLVISGVSNLRIVGQGKGKTEIVAIPRYADVLRFISSENISLEGLTLGHTETGECAGDVLGFMNVTNLAIRDCGLYGCGVWGIRADVCYNIDVENTEIYSCSAGAFIMFQCENVIMSGMDIHDMPSAETAFLNDCDDFVYEGKYLGGGSHKL